MATYYVAHPRERAQLAELHCQLFRPLYRRIFRPQGKIWFILILNADATQLRIFFLGKITPTRKSTN